MLHVELLTVGTIPKGPFREIADEYQKFLSKHARLTHRVVKTADGILDRVPDDVFVIVLESEGKQLTSEAFASQIQALEDTGRKVTVILGGPFGLSADVKAEADLLLSLSKMTTTHDLAHLFFLEQLFRALAIIHGSNYHKQYVAIFQDRSNAGELLARALEEYRGKNIVILALPRGGVEVARPIADALEAPLDILSVRKIPHPLSPEYAVAAITEHGTYVENVEELKSLPHAALKRTRDREYQEALRRRAAYTGGSLPSLQKKTVILVDDGLATGLTMKAAVLDIQKHNPENIIVAVPVGHALAAIQILPMVDDIVALAIVGGPFNGVGAYYENFPQLTDEQVIALLKTQGGAAKKKLIEISA